MSETRERIEFTVPELLRLIGLVNEWPCRNRGERKLIDRLGDLLDLTAEEKGLLNWTEELVDGRRMYRCRSDVPLARELTRTEQSQLLTLVEMPPENLPWRRTEFGLCKALIQKLGGEPDADA